MTKSNRSLQALLTTITTLRGSSGCPWDRKQTTKSLIAHFISESEELESAIESDDHENICEELGDLLYIIVMMAEINRDLGNFDLTDVLKHINEKLIRRHPHVFAGKPYANEEQLTEQWNSIKAAEKKKNTV